VGAGESVMTLAYRSVLTPSTVGVGSPLLGVVDRIITNGTGSDGPHAQRDPNGSVDVLSDRGSFCYPTGHTVTSDRLSTVLVAFMPPSLLMLPTLRPTT